MKAPTLIVDHPQSLTLADWLTRISISLPFFLFGTEKFSNHPGTHWVILFSEIGWGAWFRYFAGFVEVAGALLILLPRLIIVGFAILGSTMAVATFIVALLLRKPAQSLFPSSFLVGLCIAALFVNNTNHGERREIESLSLRQKTD